MEKYGNLNALLAIKSFSLEENKDIVSFFISKLKPFAQEIITIKNGNDQRENLIIGLNTRLKDVKNAIVLSGHIDTVVADEKAWNSSPYVPTQDNGKIYGLGAIDMKSFFAVILDNLDFLKNLSQPIIIALTSDEETNLNGVVKTTEKLAELNISPKLTIVGEPTNMRICTKSKSCFEYEISILGKSCHSSNPNNGINSNYIAARLILEIEKLCKKHSGTVLNANIVAGGEKINIIPSLTKVHFDLRSDSMKNVEKVLSQLERTAYKLEKKYFGCKIAFENILKIPPLEERKSKLISAILNKFNLQTSEFQGGCEAGHYQILGGDAIVFGVGDLALAHKSNEYVDKNEFEEYNKLLPRLIELATKLN